MIREAEFKDVSGIMEVAKDAHKKSLSDSVPIDPKTLRNNLQVCILSSEHFVLVLELEGKIEGAFIGVTHQLWYSKKLDLNLNQVLSNPDTTIHRYLKY